MEVKMKKVISVALCALMLLAGFTACGNNQEPVAPNTSSNSAAAGSVNEYGYDLTGCEPIEVLLAHGSEQNQIDTKYTELWMDMVTKYSDGLITFQYSHSGEMGTLVELVQQLESGVIDMSKLDVGTLATDIPIANLFQLPFMLKDWDHAAAVYDGEPGEQLEAIFAENGVIKLNTFLNGFRCFATKKAINSLDDCKGILMRCPEVDIYIQTQTILGFSPTPIAYNEMYAALSTGVVDGIDSAPLNTYEGGYHKIAPYIWYSRQMAVATFIAANRDFWNGLPEVYRQIMKDVAEYVEPLEREEAESKELGYLDLMESEGATITYPDDYYSEIVDRFQDYWATIISEVGGDSQQIVDQIQELAL
jgi:TRAP-type C4-dicarboxylate transport system substrate-binding protein